MTQKQIQALVADTVSEALKGFMANQILTQPAAAPVNGMPAPATQNPAIQQPWAKSATANSKGRKDIRLQVLDIAKTTTGTVLKLGWGQDTVKGKLRNYGFGLSGHLPNESSVEFHHVNGWNRLAEDGSKTAIVVMDAIRKYFPTAI